MLAILIGGGWLMLPIIFCSVITFAVILERLLFLQKSRFIDYDILSEIYNLKNNKLESGDDLAKLFNSGFLGKITNIIYYNKNNQEFMNEQISWEFSNLVQKLKRNLWILSSLSYITPLFGLLGTVVGMIEVFSKLVELNGTPDQLAGGISQALITTASGLIVAIPAGFFYKKFEVKIENILFELESCTNFIIKSLIRQKLNDS